jgi:hypothetical protein
MMDWEPTLCELNPPISHTVIWLDTSAYKDVYTAICNNELDYADIRDFFPKDPA